VLAGSAVALVAGVIGGLIGGYFFKPTTEQIAFEALSPEEFCDVWDMAAAQRAYRLTTVIGNYRLYETGNLGPLAFGPLTVTTTYMNLTVQLSDDYVSVVGPKRSVVKIKQRIDAASRQARERLEAVRRSH
jgi:hypothetical protein